MDVFEGIKKVFKDDQIKKKVGIIFAVYFVLSLISLGINVLIYATSFMSEYMETVSNFGSYMYMMSSLLPIGISFLTIPVSLYFIGYQFLGARRLQEGKVVDVLPEHNEIGKKLKVGGVHFLFGLITTFPAALLFAGGIVMTLIGSFGLEDGGNAAYVALIICGILLSLVFFAVLVLVNTFVVPSMMYLYLKYDKISVALVPANVWKVVKAGVVDFLMLLLVNMAMGVISGIAAFVLCCIGFIVTPLAQALTIAVIAGATGSVFASIDKKMAAK